MRRNRRSSADDVLESVIDGALMGAGIGLLDHFFNGHSDGSISSSQADTPDVAASDISDTTFGGGDFGGGGAGGEW